MADDIPEDLQALHKVRRILRQGGQKMIERGVDPADVATGAGYATFDLAELIAGEGMAAVEWIRTLADVLEHSVLSGGKRMVEN